MWFSKTHTIQLLWIAFGLELVMTFGAGALAMYAYRFRRSVETLGPNTGTIAAEARARIEETNDPARWKSEALRWNDAFTRQLDITHSTANACVEIFRTVAIPSTGLLLLTALTICVERRRGRQS